MHAAADQPPLRSRVFWTAVLTAHGFGAVVWWWMMPGGFPVAHPRFWVNRVIPVLVVAIAVTAFIARARRRPRAFALAMLAMPVAWTAAAVAGKIVFPISGTRIAVIGLAAAVVMALAWWKDLRRYAPRRLAIIVATFAIGFGVVLPLTQRSDDASTRPLDAASLPVVAEPTTNTTVAESVYRSERFGPSLQVQPGDGTVTCRFGNVMMTVQPLLTFISRSPDRCWTIFAPRDGRIGPGRKLTSRVRVGDERLRLSWLDDGVTALELRPTDGDLGLEAVTRLPRTVYSHLNTFTEIGLFGHRDLAVEFSACPGVRAPIEPSDYPVGRPARFAYLGADGVFRVVEASSGEKGPFRELARGPLDRDEPLTITLHDAGAPLCRITLTDWASQSSVALSPTAGWRVPVNAIEFSRYGDTPTSPAGISITLAGTSVGRGWDSVGHGQGTYRNRMRIERFSP